MSGRPNPCITCRTKPRAWRGERYCYDCRPDGPVAPPPCERCGSTDDYYASGLCGRCHLHAPQPVDACLDCHAWGATRTNQWLCRCCVSWRARYTRIGRCIACGSTLTVSTRHVCRLCRTQARRLRGDHRALDLTGANRWGAQLFFADMHKKRVLAAKQPEPPPPARRRPARPVTHRQLVLFAMPYDLSGGRRGIGPPCDPVLAQALDDHVTAYGAEVGWDRALISKVRCGIRLLLSMQDTPGAAITVTEAQVLRQINIPQRPVLLALGEVGMVDDDRTPAVRTWFDRHTTGLPEKMFDEMHTWFDVMHNGSAAPPRRKPRSPKTINLYLTAALPALHGWVDAGHESLREIGRQDVLAALPSAGNDRAMMGRALRSIFGILKARKLVFANPTTRLHIWIDSTKPPAPIDLRSVHAALDSPNPARALLAALVTYHALRTSQLRNLKLTDLRDRHLHLERRVIPIDGPVRRRLAAWLDDRDTRWPTTTNPYLFIHFRTAARTEPVGRRWIKLTLDLPGGVQALRRDRILDEAVASGGDARRLCDLFGISINHALRFTAAIREPHLPEDVDLPD